MIEPFIKHGSRILLETPIFKLREDQSEHPRTGHRAPYYVLENPDWVKIVALTPEKQVVLVRQYRHGTGAVELELPAGMCEPGESPERTAARELEEETGYRPATVKILGSVSPNAAYQQNRCTSILAEGCTLAGQTHFDPGEDLELVLVSLTELRELMRAGRMRNALGMVALLWWLDGAGRVSWPAGREESSGPHESAPG